MNKRRRSWLLGFYAEWWGALFLLFKGYWPVRHRYKTPVGEVDLILRRGSLVVFLEVKYRSTPEDFSHALGAQQKKRIQRAATYFLKGLSKVPPLRFDVLLVKPWSLPVHIKGVH